MKNNDIGKYHTFCQSLQILLRSKKATPKQEFVLEGTARNFIMAFDISWKVMKDILIKQMGITDFAIGSPRVVLQLSFQNKLIDDDQWMQMLKTRNQLAHDYDGTLAESSFEDIIHIYCPLFEKFRDTVKVYYE